MDALIDDKKSWCPYIKASEKLKREHYSVVEPGSVPAVFRDYSSESKIPASPPNGGLFSDKQSTKPWANIPITPSMTNLIHHNLRSANPPPGALEQYVGTDRLGNNYAPMPGVYWYNPDNMHGMYQIKGVKACEASRCINNCNHLN